MKNTFFGASIFVAALLLPRIGQSQGAAWTSAFQAGAAEYGAAVVAIDADHNQIVTGFLTEPTTFGATTLAPAPGTGVPIFVAKRDSAGQWLWAVASEGSGDVQTTDVVADAAGNIYISGMYQQGAPRFGTQTLTTASATAPHGFIVALTAAGQWRWATAVRSAAGDGARAEQLALGGGALYATGFFTGTGLFGVISRQSEAGSQDAFVAALDATTGQFTWVQTGGGPSDDAGTGIATDAAGNVYATGNFDFPAARFDGNNFIFIGAGGTDIWVGKLTPAGQWRWATSVGGTESELATSLAVAPGTNQVAVVGFLTGGVTFGAAGPAPALRGAADGFLALLDTAGTWQHVSTIGEAGAETIPYDLAWAPGGVELVMAGSFTASVQFGTGGPTGGPILASAGGLDAFVARWTWGLGWVDALRAGDSGEEEAVRLAVDRTTTGQLRVLTAGYFTSSTVDFGAITLINPATGGNLLGPLFVAEARFGPLLLSTPADAAAGALTLAPNPAAGLTHLTLSAPPAAPLVAELLDGLGRPVRHTTVEVGQTSAALDLRGLAPGLYVVRVGGQTRRLIIE